MGVTLFDRRTEDIIFDVNFWHWRAIVEAIKSLGELPADRADALHEQWQGTGLSREEARSVAAALRERLIPTLGAGERLLIDGRRTTEPDDMVWYRGADQHKNYSTNREVLEQFVQFCQACDGFTVN